LAFNLDKNTAIFKLYEKEYATIRNLFISGFPSFEEVYSSIIELREIA
jgi:hypothetical protein